VGRVARRQDAAGCGWWETTGGRQWRLRRVVTTSESYDGAWWFNSATPVSEMVEKGAWEEGRSVGARRRRAAVAALAAGAAGAEGRWRGGEEEDSHWWAGGDFLGVMN
jgi:hypothetical protein